MIKHIKRGTPGLHREPAFNLKLVQVGMPGPDQEMLVRVGPDVHGPKGWVIQ